jgi:hypothetical protein
VAQANLAGYAGQDVRTGKGRNETGMTTYRLGLYAFGELTVGVGPVSHAPDFAPGLTVALAGASPVLTPLLVDATGFGARVAAGSAFGVAGQSVAVDCRLSVVSDEAPPRGMTLDVLSLGGTRVGLVGTEALQPGVTYTVTDVAEIETLLALSGYRQATDGMGGEAVLCFTQGTLIDTPDGPRLIEVLRPGDLVTTLGNGSQPLRWIGSRRITAFEMVQTPELQPVEFATGAIGNARPLWVSPQHRILLNDWRAQVFFGEDEVLIPAKAMVNDRTIRQVLPAEGVTYIHLLFDRHEIILCEGALSESFHPGETGLQSLDEAQRRELDLLFPGLELERRRAAFPIVRLSEARALRLPD